MTTFDRILLLVSIFCIALFGALFWVSSGQTSAKKALPAHTTGASTAVAQRDIPGLTRFPHVKENLRGRGNQRKDSRAKPVSQLPKHIKLLRNRVILFADFKQLKNGSLPVYLINNTTQRLVFPTQDSQLYIMPEVFFQKKWQRGARHHYSGCGNSYFHPLSLRAGTFYSRKKKIEFLSSQTSAKSLPIRFRIYSGQSVISNFKNLSIDLKKLNKGIQDAQFDRMAAKYGNLNKIKQILTQKKSTSKRSYRLELIKRFALYRLPLFPKKDAVPVIQAFLRSKDAPGELWRLAYDQLYKMQPKKTKLQLAKALISADAKLRRKFVKHWDLLIKADPLIVQKHFRPIAENPKHTDNQYALQVLVYYKNAKLQKWLQKVQHDPKYPLDRRLWLQTSFQKRHGEHLFYISHRFIRPKHNKLVFQAKVPLQITLQNATKKTLKFSYSDPRELIAFYIKQANNFLPPKQKMMWYKSASAQKAKVKVSLAPGQVHTMTIQDILWNTQLPKSKKTTLRIHSISCRIPGLHKVPQYGSSGKNFSVVQ